MRGGMRLGFIMLLLIGGLACNLTQADPPEEVGLFGTAPAGGDASGAPPTIQIVAPVSGQQVTVGDSVEIQVVATDPRGVERVQLRQGSLNVSVKGFPEGTSNGEALLRWLPDRPGRYELSAIAYRGILFSEPATITLEVVRRGDPLSNPAGGQPQAVNPASGDCVGRLLINNLRMRSGPSTTSENRGNFNLNEQVTVVGQNAAASWIRVRRLDNSEHWASNSPEWIELTGSGCTSLPTVG